MTKSSQYFGWGESKSDREQVRAEMCTWNDIKRKEYWLELLVVLLLNWWEKVQKGWDNRGNWLDLTWLCSSRHNCQCCNRSLVCCNQHTVALPGNHIVCWRGAFFVAPSDNALTDATVIYHLLPQKRCYNNDTHTQPLLSSIVSPSGTADHFWYTSSSFTPVLLLL